MARIRKSRSPMVCIWAAAPARAATPCAWREELAKRRSDGVGHRRGLLADRRWTTLKWLTAPLPSPGTRRNNRSESGSRRCRPPRRCRCTVPTMSKVSPSRRPVFATLVTTGMRSPIFQPYFSSSGFAHQRAGSGFLEGCDVVRGDRVGEGGKPVLVGADRDDAHLLRGLRCIPRTIPPARRPGRPAPT